MSALEFLKLAMDQKLDRSREIYITPCPGADGTAAVVIAVNGSPPRVLVAMQSSGNRDADGHFPEIRDIRQGCSGMVRRPATPRSPRMDAYKVLRKVFNEMLHQSSTVAL